MTFLSLITYAERRGMTFEQIGLRRIVLSRGGIPIAFRIGRHGAWVRDL